MLVKVFEDFDEATVVLDCIDVLVEVDSGPDEVVAVAESSVGKLWELVDYEIGISANGKVPAGGRELD